MQKICKHHGLTEFVTRTDGRDRCKKCAVIAVQKRRLALKEKAVAYKGGKCERCNYNKCIAALEFHHTNPNEKDFGISTTGNIRAWEKIKNELDKCILVCANCHREIHEEIGR